MNKKTIGLLMGATSGFVIGLPVGIRRGITSSIVLAMLMALLFPFSTCGGQNEVALYNQARPLESGYHERKLQMDDRERIYFIYVPASYNNNGPTPMVLNLHGGGGTPKAQRHTSMMTKVSDREGFIVVYPQGTNRRGKIIPGYTWNAGACCGWAQKHEIDDTAFIGALIDDLRKLINIDEKRIYATGHSNGAMMCYRMACELSDRIAAIAPVSGPMQMKGCRPSRPVPIMHFHGTDDPFVPFEGGKGPRSLPGQFFASVDETIKFWLEVNGIDSIKPKASRKGNAVKSYFGPGTNGAEVVLWRLEGGGHTWPGGQFGFFKEKTLGLMNTDISASNLMWEFFRRHSLP